MAGVDQVAIWATRLVGQHEDVGFLAQLLQHSQGCLDLRWSAALVGHLLAVLLEAFFTTAFFTAALFVVGLCVVSLFAVGCIAAALFAVGCFAVSLFAAGCFAAGTQTNRKEPILNFRNF
jgi:hypothetical protein